MKKLCRPKVRGGRKRKRNKIKLKRISLFLLFLLSLGSTKSDGKKTESVQLRMRSNTQKESRFEWKKG